MKQTGKRGCCCSSTTLIEGGQKFKLSGKGFSRPRGGRRGDMFVIVTVTVPKGLDSAAKEAIDQIEKSYSGDPREGMVEQ